MNGHEMTIVPAPAEIAEIRTLSGDTSLFRLRLDRGNFSFVPGQFVQLSVPAGGEIPVSPASAPGEGDLLDLCVRRVGRVTSLLHAAEAGERLGIRGPFGAGFPLEEMEGKHVLLLAGGLGIAPIRSLLRHLVRERERYASVTLMYGAREPAAMLFREELVELSQGDRFRLFLTVDFVRDEPPGQFACTIGLLPGLLKGVTLDPDTTCVAVCGPPPLYECLVGELEAMGFADDRIFLSLERRMKCGMGRCCHCAVGQLFCCTDGPVFRYRDIKAIPGAI